MNNKRILQIVILVLLVVVDWLLWPKLNRPEPQGDDDNNNSLITDFSSCVAYEGEIVDGEPVRCIAPDGRIFEEEEHTPAPVVLENPQYGQLVTSPLGVRGKALGNWFFEANIPVTLKDENGKVLAQQGFQAIGDWMTNDYVLFAGTMAFDPGDAEFGVLIIERDNPSGLPENDASFAIPVRFK